MASLDDLSLEDLQALKAGKLDAVSLQGLQSLKAMHAPEPSLGDKIIQGAKNVGAGFVRGAASIGATLTTSTRNFDPNTGEPLSGNYLSRRAETLGKVDNALADITGADTGSTSYKVGKIGGEVAGTAGAGGVLAQGARAIAPGLTAIPQVANVVRAVETSGAQGGNLLSRAAGGSIAGAAQTALAAPERMGQGAAIGAALPVVGTIAGKAGSAVGNMLRGAPADAQRLAAARAAQDAGFVIPPSDVQKQGFITEALGGLSGKIKTAQEASARNQPLANAAVKRELGMSADEPLTREGLEALRRNAGQAYDTVSNAGTITPGAAYNKALDDIAGPALKAAQGFPNAKPSPVIQLVESLRSPSFDAGSAVAKLKELRSAADDAFRTGNTDVGRASKAAAKALEDAVEAHLQKAGNPDALAAFRDARQLIAKTYTIEKALNSGTGDVSMQNLASQLKKGKPLSGDLKMLAQTAESFPKATQALKESPKQLSPLDMAVAGGGAMAQGPLGAVGLLARPLTRNLLLSGPIQSYASRDIGPSMIGQSLNALSGPAYRAAPILLNRDQ
jgi:hypothetical protein